MIVKNCLPFNIDLRFKDSSNVIQKESLSKNEEKHLFCFKMDMSVSVEILVDGFKPAQHAIFDLVKYKELDNTITLTDKFECCT